MVRVPQGAIVCGTTRLRSTRRLAHLAELSHISAQLGPVESKYIEYEYGKLTLRSHRDRTIANQAISSERASAKSFTVRLENTVCSQSCVVQPERS